MIDYLIGYLVFQAAVIAGAITVSRRRRFKRLRRLTTPPPEGFVKTEEIFIDPTTNVMQRVWYHPQTGERYYETIK